MNQEYDDDYQEYQQEDENQVEIDQNNQPDDDNPDMNDLINNQQIQDDESEDDDFPEYANEQNKKLNHIIKEKRKLIKEFRMKYQEKSDRVKVLKEHYKNVNNELLNTQ